MKPTFADIAAFLEEKGVSKECPRCKAQTWNVNTSPSPWAAFWGANDKDQYSFDAPMYGAFLLICKNCGYISPHSQHYFNEWFEGRKKT